MYSDFPENSLGAQLDGTRLLRHEARTSWIPRVLLPSAFEITKHWSVRRREPAYLRLSRLAVLAGTQH